MATGTAERATEVVVGEEVVAAAESIVASAAKAEGKTSVTSATTEQGESRAWDAKAQID